MPLKPQKLLSIGFKLENYDRPIWKNQIAWILIGITFIVIGMSRLNANLANETISVLNNKKALISVSLATAISLSSGLIEINFLPIYRFERIAIYFGLLGLFAHLFSFNYQITSLKIDLLYWLKLIMCFAIVCFLINRYIGSFSLSDNRIIGFITLILPITLVSLVIEKLIASSSIWTAILLRGLPIIGFSMLLILFPEQYGLLFTTVLIYILYFIVFGDIGRHQRKKIGHAKVGLAHGIFLSFAFAATNPIFAP